jgi:hypothetical protein
MHIHLSQYFRQNFIKLSQKTLDLCGEKIDAKDYYNSNSKHKLLSSETPNFEEIF